MKHGQQNIKEVWEVAVDNSVHLILPGSFQALGFLNLLSLFFSHNACICIFPFLQTFSSRSEALFILSFTLEGQRWPPFERECVLSVAGTCVCVCVCVCVRVCGRCRKKVASRFIWVTLCKPVMYFADRKKIVVQFPSSLPTSCLYQRTLSYEFRTFTSVWCRG